MKRRLAPRDAAGFASKTPPSGAAQVSPTGGESSPPSRLSANRVRLLGWLLGLIVFAVYLPVVRHDFICYDDNGYVTANPWVKNGLTWANVAHAFRTTELAYWHPLTWLSHLADVTLFGQQSWGHHLTNAVLHALNTLLVFLVLRRLTLAVWRSWLVAALFGLHPLHVESVAWVAERKDVLSTFFLLLAIWSYATWVGRKQLRQPRAEWFYALTLLAFAAGLMSKPMVVTLPCLLLLLDYWPLNRWRPGVTGDGARMLGKLVAEKIPFFVLVAGASVLTLRAQSALGTLQNDTVFPWAMRVANALVSYGDYLVKCFVPTKLAVFYPYPKSPPVWPAVGAGAVLAGISLVAIASRNRRPYLLVGWLWFLGTLVPVIGLVQVGTQAMADRYSYVPLIGVFICLVWGVADATQGRPRRTWLLAPAAAGVLAVVATLTSRQIGFWRDSPTLFHHALDVTEDNWCAHFCLGYHYAQQPATLAESIAEYREVVRLEPNFAEGHFSLGAMLARQLESTAETAAEFQTALRLKPADAKACYALARALEQLPGRSAETVAAWEAAVRLDPENADAHNRLGNTLAQLPGRLPDAITEYQTVLRLQPDWVEVRSNLGIALAQIPGRRLEAIAEYEAVLRAKPDFAEAHNNLANALMDAPGRERDAIAEFEAAIRLRPDFFEAEFNLGNFLSRFPDRIPEAIAHFEAALKIKPDLEIARTMIAQLRAGAAR